MERQVEITGPDAFAFTNMLVPRDLSKCQVDQTKYVFITTEDGGIINDPVLLRLGENHFYFTTIHFILALPIICGIIYVIFQMIFIAKLRNGWCK